MVLFSLLLIENIKKKKAQPRVNLSPAVGEKILD